MNDCQGCEKFRGRELDTCLGRGLDGRKHPPEYAVRAFRERHGIECEYVKPSGKSGGVKLGLPAVSAAKPWDVTQSSRGLGDSIKKLLHSTGIDKVVEKIVGKKGCGCNKRQSALNSAVPYKDAT